MKQNFDCNYTSPIDLAPSGFQFAEESIGKTVIKIQIWFDLTKDGGNITQSVKKMQFFIRVFVSRFLLEFVWSLCCLPRGPWTDERYVGPPWGLLLLLLLYLDCIFVLCFYFLHFFVVPLYFYFTFVLFVFMLVGIVRLFCVVCLFVIMWFGVFCFVFFGCA